MALIGRYYFEANPKESYVVLESAGPSRALTTLRLTPGNNVEAVAPEDAKDVTDRAFKSLNG